jgi:CelD/BcsL family acetyltransferase involved in cellulose biosynthesis
VIDLVAARTAGWPRPSTAKRLQRFERRLTTLGQMEWRHVRGNGWTPEVLEDLGRIEAQSWIAHTTDGSGAKFMSAAQRALWQAALGDPVIADRLAATILMLDQRPVAFSFDLDDGAVQYGIAGSYVSALAKYEVGKIVNARAISDAMAAGCSVTDLGVGDSGYKEYLGAAPAYDMEDLLFVRSRTAARMLANVWGAERNPAQPVAPRAKVVVMHG